MTMKGGRASLSTKRLEPILGDMIRNPKFVFEKADEMVRIFRRRIAQAEAMACPASSLRYDYALNRWLKQSSLRIRIPSNGSYSFVAINGELYVLNTLSHSRDALDQRRASKKRMALEIQIYKPRRKKWRFPTARH